MIFAGNRPMSVVRSKPSATATNVPSRLLDALDVGQRVDQGPPESVEAGDD